MINEHGVEYVTLGEFLEFTESLPLDTPISLGWHTDLGVPEHPAYTTSFAAKITFVDHGSDVGAEVILKTLSVAKEEARQFGKD